MRRTISMTLLSLLLSICTLAQSPASPAAKSFAQTEMLSADASLGFGSALAVDRHEDTLVVGAVLGAAYVFQRSKDGRFRKVAKLTPSDGVAIGGQVSISGDGNTILVGFPFYYQPGAAAYIFVKPAEGWKNANETAKLTASDGQPWDGFGSSAAISSDGSTAFIGAFGATINNRFWAGEVYIFRRLGRVWASTADYSAKLTSSDESTLAFGAVLSLSRNDRTLMVGTDRAAYVFVRPGSTWSTTTETAKLTPPVYPMPGDLGIRCISLDQDSGTVLIGAPDAYGFAEAAYVFVRPPGGWIDMSATAKLKPPYGDEDHGYGVSVALSADGREALIGTLISPFHFANGPGAAYLFDRPLHGWETTTQFRQRLTAPTPSDDGFGSATLIIGPKNKRTLFVGASGGAVYVFEQQL